MPGPAPCNGSASAAVNRRLVRRSRASPNMERATGSTFASFTRRQARTTSSVRALPRASGPTAQLPTRPAPAVTNAAASQPTVALPPPRKQRAPLVSRTAADATAPTQSSLRRAVPAPVRRAATPAPQVPQNLGLDESDESNESEVSGDSNGSDDKSDDVDMQPILDRIALAEQICEQQQCTNHSDPEHIGRDPMLLAQDAKRYSYDDKLPQCQSGRRTSSSGRPIDPDRIDQSHIWGRLPDEELFDAFARFFESCGSSRRIENRFSTAPKAKRVQFAETLVSGYRCIPRNATQPRYFARWGETTLSWEPTEEQLEEFRDQAEFF